MFGWLNKREPTPPLPPLPPPVVDAVADEVQQAQSLLSRLRITIEFALDEREFANCGPRDIERLMKPR